MFFLLSFHWLMKAVSRFLKGVSRTSVLTGENQMKACGQNKKGDSLLTLRGSSDSKQKRKTEGGEKTRAAMLRILRAAFQVRFLSKFATPITSHGLDLRAVCVFAVAYQIKRLGQTRMSVNLLTNKTKQRNDSRVMQTMLHVCITACGRCGSAPVTRRFTFSNC